MEFNVKGITFNKEELTTIALTDIKVDTISRAHFFHILPGGKRAVLLLRAGDYVESAFISKYIEKGMVSLYQLEICSEEDLSEYKMMWAELRAARTQRAQFLLRDSIIKKIAHDFWNSNEKSFLSFMIACFEEFYVYDIDVLEKYQRLSMVLYSRALLTSAISSLTALCNGYVDHKFVKDFYNTSFIMDYGLIEYEDFNYALSLASESERNIPGSGLSTLEKYNRSEGEKILFTGHANISYEFAIQFADRFENPEVLDVIQMHHEKCDGSGFPNGYSYSALSDTETLLMFCDYLIPFQEHIFTVGDGQTILNGYLKQLNELEGKYLLPINKLMANWEMMMNWAIEKKQLGEVA
jgi:hypothetical protein